MSTFIQFVITGLRLGSVYALIALGYTMVYGIIKLINFAHGDFIMVGGYTLYFTIPYILFSKTIMIGSVSVSTATLITILVSALSMIFLYLFTQNTKTGRAMRCVAEDKEAAIGAGLAAVLGGIGSLPGAVVGGLIIGIVQSGTNSYISSSMSDTFVYLILIIVLLIKPAGIQGKNVGEKV